MRCHTIAAIGLPLLGIVVASLPSASTGALPGTTTIFGPIPNDVARRAPSCGTCHNATPGNTTNPIDVMVQPQKLALALGEQISVTVQSQGGTQVTGDPGGFVTEASAGTLSAGANSKTNASGTHVTHVAPTGHGRSWTFGYTAPAQPGLIELFGVVNTVNRNAVPDAGDTWAFHGFDQTATVNTPVRMYALHPDIKPAGAGCPDGFGNLAILGGSQPATVGNGSFGFELHGAAPNSLAFLLLGFSQPASPTPLDSFGIQGCFGHINLPAQTFTTGTTMGNVQRAEGSAFFALPIRNDPALAGVSAFVQAAYLDGSARTLAGRTLPLTFTNALSFTIR